ncbi:hypothetical protein ATANTOWER_023298 [Ataeniobius toweri]|uniref:Uncharacterized protein n=1 Tax=Ataeniobius toweri TaxID=208326 RepID=A0ABU7B8A6_9TELE|nr:hypothetical protein [Ataeniobius toweri]
MHKTLHSFCLTPSDLHVKSTTLSEVLFKQADISERLLSGGWTAASAQPNFCNFPKLTKSTSMSCPARCMLVRTGQNSAFLLLPLPPFKVESLSVSELQPQKGALGEEMEESCQNVVSFRFSL